jgi:hypothetical protein
LLPVTQQKQISYAKIGEESDISLEVVILLIFGLFGTLFGLLLLKIHTGELPYNPDSMYGLFLILISIQTITMGKTPFGDLRRSWLVILIGIGMAVIGMTACFIPGPLTGLVRILAGTLLTVGGAGLLFQLFVAEEKAKTWMKAPGILRHLTLAACLVYVLSVLLGLVTLIPGITDPSADGGLPHPLRDQFFLSRLEYPGGRKAVSSGISKKICCCYLGSG